MGLPIVERANRHWDFDRSFLQHAGALPNCNGGALRIGKPCHELVVGCGVMVRRSFLPILCSKVLLM